MARRLRGLLSLDPIGRPRFLRGSGAVDFSLTVIEAGVSLSNNIPGTFVTRDVSANASGALMTVLRIFNRSSNSRSLLPSITSLCFGKFAGHSKGFFFLSVSLSSPNLGNTDSSKMQSSNRAK